MALKNCPICGEKYSDTYRDCPFCEEEEALLDGEEIRRSLKKRSSRVARGSFSVVTPLLIVLILLLAGLLMYLLYGDELLEKFGMKPSPDQPPIEQVQEPTELPTEEPTEVEEPTEEPSETGVMPEVPTDTEPEQEEGLTYEAAAKLPDGLSLSTEDFTMKSLGETHTIRVSGGSGTYQWVSENESVASVDQSGKVTAISGGNTNVLVTDGTKKAICIVRVSARGTLEQKPTENNSGSGGTYTLNREDFTLGVGETFKLQLSGSGTGLTWKTGNSKVATVSSNGTVKGVGRGNTKITVSWSGGSTSCIVRVS